MDIEQSWLAMLTVEIETDMYWLK